MAIIKCKMCGGDLVIEQGNTVAECEYCGSKQTLPRLDNEKKLNLYDRANHFRRNNEFDKAMGIYEQILNEDNTDSEAYWSLVLCKYGIEYVEENGKRVPTVNRAQFTSVLADEDYKSAIQYADIIQKSIYEAEAKAIDEIQKGILEISQKEEPFDVFICYKETDNNGRRTPDSVLATELYHELTKEGFKVFFSRITLEDKLGTAYEPYIFAALNTSKVMVALGTKPEYFNAVWVKNEWSRYLSLIKNGAKKILIPAYRDMDPYDLPEEFSHLQAQDMSKLGFMQDLVRGITKIVSVEKPQTETVVKQTIITEGNANTAPLLKRAFMFLEDGDWNSADEYCEKVLDIDPECAEAYLGKLMAELRVRKKEELKDCKNPFEERNNCQKAMRFGDEAFTAFVKDCTKYINERNENERLINLYNNAVSKMNSANTEAEFKSASALFDEIKGFKDSESLSKQCLEKAEMARKDAILSEGKSNMTGEVISNYESAIKLFESISGWKDADEQIEICKKKIEEIKAKEEARRLERERKAEIKRKEAEQRARRNKKIAIITTPIVCAIIAFIIVLNTVIIPNGKYNDAIALMSAEKYTDAKNIFEKLGDYKDSKEKINECNLKHREYLYPLFERTTISAGDRHSLGLKSDGTVVATGDNDDGQCNVSAWKDIVSISAGDAHSLGLKSDGTVVATGSNGCGQCNVSEWSDVIAISAGVNHSLGLKSDGTVVATGYNGGGQCNVSEWSDIIAISAGGWYSLGLKSDGTVVATGRNNEGQCDVSEWKDIVSISAGGWHSLGLKSDGTVVATGNNEDDRCDVSEWSGIIAILAGGWHSLGLKSDGTVVATGDNTFGECDVSEWTDICVPSKIMENILEARENKYNNALKLMEEGKYTESISIFETLNGYKDSVEKISELQEKRREYLSPLFIRVSIAAGFGNSLGLKSDGTVVAIGDNIYGQLNVSEWKDIVSVSSGGNASYALKNDGTVLAIGYNENNRCEVSDWTDIIAIEAGTRYVLGLKFDGTVQIVGYMDKGPVDEDEIHEWKDIVALAAGYSFALGLKSDGTVVSTDDRDLSEWTDIVAISAEDDNAVGLKSDGTVVVSMGNELYNKEMDISKISTWTDIVDVSCAYGIILGLKSNGTVLAVKSEGRKTFDFSDWSDIVEIATANYHCLGLKSDGTVVAIGLTNSSSYYKGSSNWNNIYVPAKD